MIWRLEILPLLLGYGPMLVASSRQAFGTSALILESLVARDECPANTFRCSEELGAVFSDICCPSGQVCALDNNNSPACCPSGAVCTGTAPADAPTANPTQATSYVENEWFSFPYAMTSFGNSAACASAIEACSGNFDICTARLGGGGDGLAVTIEVPGGGGVTITDAADSLGASATSICSSLSSEACTHLAATPCEAYDDDSGAGRSRGSLVGLAGVAIAGGVAALLAG